MKTNIFDLYSDYLMITDRYATATGLSSILNEAISHDKITRCLSKDNYNSKDLWELVKSKIREVKIREVECEDSAVIFDDTLSEKPYSQENEIISWHFDHSKKRCIKGINILNMLYCTESLSIPTGYDIVKKDVVEKDSVTDKATRKSQITKNEMMHQLLEQAIVNGVIFKWVMADIFTFGSHESSLSKNDRT